MSFIRVLLKRNIKNSNRTFQYLSACVPCGDLYPSTSSNSQPFDYSLTNSYLSRLNQFEYQRRNSDHRILLQCKDRLGLSDFKYNNLIYGNAKQSSRSICHSAFDLNPTTQFELNLCRPYSRSIFFSSSTWDSQPNNARSETTRTPKEKPNNKEGIDSVQNNDRISSPLFSNDIYSVANALSISRVIASPFLAYWILSSNYSSALLLFIAAGFTDYLDGLLARNSNSVTAVGTYLDPVCDKVLISVATFALTFQGIVPWWTTATIVGRDLALVIGAFVKRYWDVKDLSNWRQSYWAIDRVQTKIVQPLMAGKINTVGQLGLIAYGFIYAAAAIEPGLLVLPLIGSYDISWLANPELWWIFNAVITTTTAGTGAAYLYLNVKNSSAIYKKR